MMMQIIKQSFVLVGILSCFFSCGSNNSVLYYQQGQKHFAAKEIQKTEESFRKSLDEDNTFQNARLMLAKLCYYKRDFKATKYHLDEILKSDPNNIGALYWKARTLVLLSPPDEKGAVSCLNRVLEQNSHHVYARSLLALIYEKNQRYKEAIHQYERIFIEEEALINARANASILYKRLGLKDKSKGEIVTAIGIAKITGYPVTNLEKVREDIEE